MSLTDPVSNILDIIRPYVQDWEQYGGAEKLLSEPDNGFWDETTREERYHLRSLMRISQWVRPR